MVQHFLIDNNSCSIYMYMYTVVLWLKYCKLIPHSNCEEAMLIEKFVEIMCFEYQSGGLHN